MSNQDGNVGSEMGMGVHHTTAMAGDHISSSVCEEEWAVGQVAMSDHLFCRDRYLTLHKH